MNIGLIVQFGDSTTLDEAVERFVQAERDGFASAWVANIFGFDALTVLALAGRATSRIELGTAVVPTYPRHPHSLAQQAATVNAATGGRLALGLGRSHQVVIETMFGLSYDRPISHMREYVTIVRDLTRNGSCSVSGKVYNVNATLQVPGGGPFPILVGALMPKMLRLCGELCDGTLTWMCGPKYVSDTVVPTISAAAEEAGRPMPRVVCSLPVCVTDDKERARGVAAKQLAHYGVLPVYRACLDAEGAEGPADIAIVGSEDEVRAGIERMRDAGATDFYAAVFADVREGARASVERTHALLKSLGGSV